MAYTEPTAGTFKARYPEFAPVSNDLITLVLQEAISQVGDTWVEKDRARAQMLLAAHTLTMEGEPGRTTTGQGSAGTGPIKRDKVGDVETEYQNAAERYGSGVNYVNSAAGYESTEYGRRYLALLKLNFPAVAVV